MSGAVTAALVTGAVAIGTTAYTARQNKKAQAKSEAAAKNAAAKSQTQGSEAEPQFARRRRRTGAQGFDTTAAMLPAGTLGGVPASGAPLGV
jgi:hypothetical protein